MSNHFSKFFLLHALIISVPSFAEEPPIHELVNCRKSQHELIKETASSHRFWGAPSIRYGVAEHRLVGISGLDHSIELEDGSTWSISPRARNIVARWRQESPILITQNLSLLSIYNYKIENTDTGESIAANLFLGPLKNGPYTRYIVEIDDYCSYLVLNDNTRWEVSYWDTSFLSEWKIGDCVIIGYNSTWESTSAGLLINVSLNRNIRAQQF